MATIKSLQSKIELIQSEYPYEYRKALGWNKTHCNYVAKQYMEYIRYMKDVINTFKDSFIVIQEDIITVMYPNGYGKMAISEIEHEILVPAIYETIDNSRVINNSDHLQVA